MAKRAEVSKEEKADRQAGARIETLSNVKVIEIRFASAADTVRLRDEKGRVWKRLHRINGRFHVAGRLDDIEVSAEMAALDGWGVTGELTQAVAPALQRLIEEVCKIVLKDAAEKTERPAGTITPAERTKDEGRAERMRRTNAKMAAARAAKRAKCEAEAGGGNGEVVTNG